MQVFKCFCRIIYKNKTMLLVYVFIFLGLIIAFSKLEQKKDTEGFSIEKVKIGIVDLDKSKASTALSDYLGSVSEKVEIPKDKEKIQDMIFYRDVEYVLYIPKDYEADMKKGKDVELTNVKVPNSYTGNFMDRKINTYVNTLSMYMKNGFSLDEAMKLTKEATEGEAEVSIQKEEGENKEDKSPYSYYYNYYAYIIIILLILGMGVILAQFNREEIRKRMEVSCIKQSRYNMELALGGGVFSIGIWGLLNIISIILYHKEEMFFERLPWYLLISFVITVVAVCISVFCGYLVNELSALNGIGNTFSLGFAFLGGIFVPQEIMNPEVLKISQFVPTYWYVKACDLISGSNMKKMETIETVMLSVGIQMLFAITFFAIALVIKKVRAQAN